jgi:hypothetical protein
VGNDTKVIEDPDVASNSEIEMRWVNA